jgi:hypothetical protein
MESLALLVVTLISLMLIAGISAFSLTFRKTRALSNVTAKPLQRILTIFLAIISFLIGVQFVTQVDSLGGKVIGAFGITVATISIYRVFKK